MSGYTDKAVQALLRRAQLSGHHHMDGSKIADITHADTNEHTISLSSLGLPDNVIAILCYFVRFGGTGTFNCRTEPSGALYVVSHLQTALWMVGNTGELIYRLSVAGDDWDIQGFAYWTQGQMIG